jgi:hypothetical protein
MNDWKLGSVVLHPQLGSGTIIALSAERVEVKFKLRGNKELALAEAQEVLMLARAERTPGNSPLAARGSSQCLSNSPWPTCNLIYA